MNKLTTYTATILAICACMLAPPNADAAFTDTIKKIKTDTIKKIKKNVDNPADNSGKKAGGGDGAKANAETGAQTTIENTDTTMDALDLLTPQITFCPSLKKLDSSVEVRGRQYQEILDALKVSDYKMALGVMRQIFPPIGGRDVPLKEAVEGG